VSVSPYLYVCSMYRSVGRGNLNLPVPEIPLLVVNAICEKFVTGIAFGLINFIFIYYTPKTLYECLYVFIRILSRVIVILQLYGIYGRNLASIFLRICILRRKLLSYMVNILCTEKNIRRCVRMCLSLAPYPAAM